MPRTAFIEQAERQILLMDFSGLKTPDEALQAIEEARQFVAAQPRRRNLLTMVDITGSTQEKRVVDALGNLAVSMVSGRKFATFASRDDAAEWLVRQWVPPTSVPDIAR